MRYLKVLIIAILLFLAMIFFFQNQGPLSQEMQLSLNLFFIPPMTSITLPFYFLVIAAFLVGCILAVAFLLWDRCTISAKLMKTKWQVSSLEKQVTKLTAQIKQLTDEADAVKELPVSTDVSAVPAQEAAKS